MPIRIQDITEGPRKVHHTQEQIKTIAERLQAILKEVTGSEKRVILMFANDEDEACTYMSNASELMQYQFLEHSTNKIRKRMVDVMVTEIFGNDEENDSDKTDS